MLKKKSADRWAGFLTAAIVGLVLIFLAVSCETPESITRSRVKALEKGLLRAVYFKGQKPEKLRLVDRMSFYKVPGVSLAVMDKYQVEWVKTYGYKNIIEYKPLNTRTSFQVGELSQPVAAALTLSMVEEGLIGLEDRLESYYATLAFSGRKFRLLDDLQITVATLLSHSAGFYPWTSSGYSRSTPLPDLKAVLRGEELASNFHSYRGFDPEIPVRFSDFNYVLLEQYLIDRAGKKLQELASERLFQPLGLSQTFFGLPLSEDLAVGHLREGPQIEGEWFCYPEQAARGLWSNPEEYLRLVIELMDCARGKSGGLLRPELARKMLSPQVPGCGYGFRMDGQHEKFKIYLKGKTNGFRAAMLIFPAIGQGAVVMTNSENGWVLIEEILRGLSVIYDWPDYRPEEKALYRLSPEIYQQYVGRYQVNENYFLDVDYEDYYLIVHPTGQVATKFYVETQTIFFSVDPLIRIKFNFDDLGRVTGLVLWQEDYEIRATKLN